MNAVNLIPGGGPTARRTLSASKQTLAVIAGLAVVLIAAVVYVSAANDVTARKSELAGATANAAAWRTAASAFTPYVSAAEQRAGQLAAVRQLAAARLRWPLLLDQISQLLPAAAALSSLQASTAAGSGTTASPQPSVQLSGCAASQSTVAQTMQQLHRVDGVADVVLSSSNENGTDTAAASGASSTSGSGGCTFPVQFQISLTFSGASTGLAVAPSTKPTAATSTNATAATSTNATAATSTKAGAQ